MQSACTKCIPRDMRGDKNGKGMPEGDGMGQPGHKGKMGPWIKESDPFRPLRLPIWGPQCCKIGCVPWTHLSRASLGLAVPYGGHSCALRGPFLCQAATQVQLPLKPLQTKRVLPPTAVCQKLCLSHPSADTTKHSPPKDIFYNVTIVMLCTKKSTFQFDTLRIIISFLTGNFK